MVLDDVNGSQRVVPLGLTLFAIAADGTLVEGTLSSTLVATSPAS